MLVAYLDQNNYVYHFSPLFGVICYTNTYLLLLCRKRLFGMINELPTTFEVVSGKSKIKAPPTNNNHSNSKSKPNNKTVLLIL